MSTLPEFFTAWREKLKTKRTNKAAWKIIEEFFQFTDVDGFNKEIWMLAVSAMTNDNMEQAKKGRDRHDILFFCEFTQLLFEALSQIRDNRKEKKKK